MNGILPTTWNTSRQVSSTCQKACEIHQTLHQCFSAWKFHHNVPLRHQQEGAIHYHPYENSQLILDHWSAFDVHQASVHSPYQILGQLEGQSIGKNHAIRIIHLQLLPSKDLYCQGAKPFLPFLSLIQWEKIIMNCYQVQNDLEKALRWHTDKMNMQVSKFLTISSHWMTMIPRNTRCNKETLHYGINPRKERV